MSSSRPAYCFRVIVKSFSSRVTQNPPMTHKPLYAENLRKAGIRSGCFAYLFAALIVCALLAVIPLLMVFLGWLTGGAQQ